ncbi:MAG: hypothetical protein NTZ01_04900 [Verrucomicrobia bacterium]|nr:hypothetical protein [Verrucomicrobiota bacterium]
MNIRAPKTAPSSLRSEYDFSVARLGKYATRYLQGTNLVRLAPDVAKKFPSEKAVNFALRTLGQIMSKSHGNTVINSRH